MWFASLRARLLVALVATALVAVAGLTLAAVWLLQQRAEQQAVVELRAAQAQLEQSLALRKEAFAAISDLSYVLPVFRQIGAGATENADFGLGSGSDDAQQLALLHQNLVDADWSWARLGGSRAVVAAADGKGRLLYSTAQDQAFGADLKGLSAISAALQLGAAATPDQGAAVAQGPQVDVGAMLVDGRDPRLSQSGLLPAAGTEGVLVLLARATVLGGVPKALFIQAITVQDLLTDVALTAPGTHLALSGAAGQWVGSLDVRVAALAADLPENQVRAVDFGGARWLLQRHPLRLPGSPQPLGDLWVGRDLQVGLAVLLGGRWLLLAAALAALATATTAALWLSAGLARPVKALTAATRRIAQGDLAVRLQPMGAGELADLGRAFDQMAAGLAERMRLERTFKRYLAPEVVDYLLSHPEAQLPGGERREMTVMFTDLAGFTAFAERNPPELVVAMLNRCLAELAAAISDAGGTVDKFMGDNCMGFFGAPVPRPDHALRSCRAAVRQLRAIQRLSLSQTQAPLDARIGLHSGEMIVGSIGGRDAQDYTVVGDAVNLAARLEPANKVYHTHILCSQVTAQAAERAAPGELIFRELDTVQVQGRQEPVVLVEIVGLRGEGGLLPSAALQRYADGLALYRRGEFASALTGFADVLAIEPADGPAAVMKQRCLELQALPDQGQGGWRGIWQLQGK